MNITKKKYKGQPLGRPKKYEFSDLKVGYVMYFKPDIGDIQAYKKRVGNALRQWKFRSGTNWRTAVKVEGDVVGVYRLK